MLAPVAHILPLTTIRRERLLPVPGRVTVRLDQKVSPVDVIAETNLGQEHVLVDVAHALGIAADAAQRLVQVRAGERVAAGQVLAQTSGMFPHVARAPQMGRVVLVGGGRILMELSEGSYELHAGMPGTVTQVIQDRGAEITTYGALVQGVWGNGRVDVGLMLSLIAAPDEVLVPGKLDVSMRGSVLLGGILEDPAILQTAAELPLRGLILGSMSPSLIPVALQMRYPILVIDGFSRRPMNSAAYKLLNTSIKREVTLNTEGFNRFTGTRPEVIIPLPISQEPLAPREMEIFAVGQQVCVRRAPHLGAVGSITALPEELAAFPSGLRAPAAQVKLESGEEVTVPLANLEVLG
jgi:hypothetical protein